MPRLRILVLALLFATRIAATGLAIGPGDQKLPDDPNPLSIRATGLLSNTSPIGTGTIVATKLVGTTGYVSILTANHVATSRPTNLKLGSLIDGAAPWLQLTTLKKFQTFTIVDKDNNPTNLPEDVALMEARIDGLKDGTPALANFQQLAANLPTIPDPSKGGGNPLVKAASDNPVGFTQIGYGRLAAYSASIDIGNSTFISGYQATGTVGQRLFENNQAIEYAAPTIFKDPLSGTPEYYYPKVGFTAIGPPNNDGQGLGMGGDSGSPLLTQAPGNAINIPVTRSGNKIQIPLQYTDSLSAVFVSSVSVTVIEMIDGNPVKVPLDPETVAKGPAQSAIPIDTGLYSWMKPYLADPRANPEPSTITLVAASGLLGLVPRLWQR
jgi:hypothetical protein